MFVSTPERAIIMMLNGGCKRNKLWEPNPDEMVEQGSWQESARPAVLVTGAMWAVNSRSGRRQKNQK